MAREDSAGYRLLPHTADLRLEAWAPTAERCVAEAVQAVVRSFTNLPPDAPTVRREFLVRAQDAETQLVSVLDEVIYRMDVDGEIPRTVDVHRDGPRLRVAVAIVDLSRADVVGAVPKAVSLHRLRFGKNGNKWRCAVTLDV